MREIRTHHINECNKQLTLTAVDEPGVGGASHEYAIDVHRKIGVQRHGIIFQNGPIGEVGVNGLTHELLIAIVIDRLKGFQSGPYACEQNAKAIESLESARESLNSRTTDRLVRGVEGTHEV